jgi:hypothetical protein
MVTSDKTASPYLLLLAIGGGLWFSLCWPMLNGSKIPGFRDSAYLYYPLFEWLDSEWSKNGIPLWNPYCNYGMSNIGDNTTSLCYPGKAVFLLRFLDFPTRYGIYISLHVLLAVAGAFCFARVLRASLPGALLAGISFGCSGVVLTQATNVIFLVSAAWLPFAMACSWQMIWPKRHQRSWFWGIAAGCCCAMMILGGDPQMVYHVGLIAAATGASKGLGKLRTRGTKAGDCSKLRATPIQAMLGPIAALMWMIAVTVLLALVQIVPTYEWSRLSERATPDRPNLFRLISGSWSSAQNPKSSQDSSHADADSPKPSPFKLAPLFEPLSPDTVSFASYEFSLPPWALIELFVPNANGKIFPTHQRWADALVGPQGPDRVWYLSLYLGWTTAWLGLSNLTVFGVGRKAWLSRIGLFFLFGSFGWYGLCWLLPVPGCGSQVGGMYWWMNLLLPAYDSFRYPAKLFVVAGLCLCVLAGLNLNGQKLKKLAPQRTLLGWAFVAVLLIALILVSNNFLEKLFQRIPSDPLFGPFDIAGAKSGLTLSLLQVLGMMGGLTWICRSCRTRSELKAFKESTTAWPNVCCWILVGLAAIDLSLANSWVLSLVPSESFKNPAPATLLASLDPQKIVAPGEANTSKAPLTIYRPRDLAVPITWEKTSSENRLEEIIQWQRSTFYPKHHLGKQLRVVGSFGSIQPRLYENWLRAIENQKKNPNEICDGELLTRHLSNRPFFRFSSSRPTSFGLRPARFEPSKGFSYEPIPDSELIIKKFGCDSVDLTIKSPKQFQFVYACIFDGNWEANIRCRTTGQEDSRPLIEFEPGFQGLELEPGEYEIQLTYRPGSFLVAARISAWSWLLAVVAGIVSWTRTACRPSEVIPIEHGAGHERIRPMDRPKN